MKIRKKHRDRDRSDIRFCEDCGAVTDAGSRAERRIEDARLWAMTGGAWRLR